MGFVTRSFVARAEREKQHCTRQPRSSLTVCAGRGGGRVGGGDGVGGGGGGSGVMGVLQKQERAGTNDCKWRGELRFNLHLSISLCGKNNVLEGGRKKGSRRA